MKQILSTLVLLMMVLNSYPAYAAEAIPRSLGKLYLGMTTREFEKLTQIKPLYCATCKPYEKHADLSEKKLAQIDQKNNKWHGADLFFWKNKLYYISVAIQIIDIESELIKFATKYGQPLDHKIPPDGFSYTWKDKNTELSHPVTEKTGKFVDFCPIHPKL